MKLKAVSLVLGLIAFIIFPAMALSGNETTLSFSDDSFLAHSDLEFYGLNASGVWVDLGLWNTSSTGLILTPGVYSVKVHASGLATLANPVAWVQDGFTWVQTNSFAILFILLCIGLLAGLIGSRRRK